MDFCLLKFLYLSSISSHAPTFTPLRPSSSSISDALCSGHVIHASPASALQRSRGPGNLTRRLPSQDRGCSVSGAQVTSSGLPGSVRSDSARPRSAQNSPTRSSGTGKPRCRDPVERSGTIANMEEVNVFCSTSSYISIHLSTFSKGLL